MTLDICHLCSDPGQCCRYLELPLARALTPDEQNWVNLHPETRMVGPSTIRITSTCSALTQENKCSLYGTSARPVMCSVWPDAPESQAPEGCAYLTEKGLQPSPAH